MRSREIIQFEREEIKTIIENNIEEKLIIHGKIFLKTEIII